MALKSILESIENAKFCKPGNINPAKKMNNDKKRDKSIRPIVIGSLRNLKLTYIKTADIVTRIEDISNIFTTNLRSHQNQSYQAQHLDHLAYFYKPLTSLEDHIYNILFPLDLHVSQGNYHEGPDV